MPSPRVWRLHCPSARALRNGRDLSLCRVPIRVVGAHRLAAAERSTTPRRTPLRVLTFLRRLPLPRLGLVMMPSQTMNVHQHLSLKLISACFGPRIHYGRLVTDPPVPEDFERTTLQPCARCQNADHVTVSTFHFDSTRYLHWRCGKCGHAWFSPDRRQPPRA
jgi:ribosomal protein S27AE